MIVFTQYDRLVRTKEDELQEEDGNIDPATLEDQSKEEARKAFEVCVKSLRRTMDRLKIPLPGYVKVSGISIQLFFLPGLDPLLVRPGYKEDVSALVEITQDSVREWVKDDGPWIMWAIAQRASVAVKIDACVTYVYFLLQSQHLLTLTSLLKG